MMKEEPVEKWCMTNTASGEGILGKLFAQEDTTMTEMVNNVLADSGGQPISLQQPSPSAAIAMAVVAGVFAVALLVSGVLLRKKLILGTKKRLCN